MDKNHGDHETRLRAIEDGLLPKWMLPAIGTIVAIAAALASHVAWR